MDKEYIKGVISLIEKGKKAEGVMPDYALMETVKTYVIDDLLKALREMCKDGTLEWHKTLNSVGFSVKGGINE